MKVFVVIVNFNRTQETLGCLRSVGNLEIKDSWQLKTIVVDNSPKKTLKGKIKEFSNVKLIETKENTGFAGGNNIGIKHALKNKADFVMLLNNDAFIAPKVLIYLIKAALKKKNIGIFSPKIYFASGFEYHQQKYHKKDLGKVIWYAGGHIDWQNIMGVHENIDKVDKGQFKKSKEVEFVSGCCMLIKKEVFEKIGLLDEKYFLYLEDMDFCVRAKKAGFKLFFEPKAIVWHKNLGTSKKTASDIQAYYYTRNRLLFAFKYADPRAKAAIFRESLKLLIKGNNQQKKGVIDFYLRKFGYRVVIPDRLKA